MTELIKVEYKLIVAGGRDFNDYVRLCEELDRLRTNQLHMYLVRIVSGLARGADALGVRYADEHGLDYYGMAADWDTYGKSAGHRRNREMGDFADGLLAFWDGHSRGTKGMIDYMRSLKKPVRVIRY